MDTHGPLQGRTDRAAAPMAQSYCVLRHMRVRVCRSVGSADPRIYPSIRHSRVVGQSLVGGSQHL